MATFKQYTKKNGEKQWMFKAYLGTDYLTGIRIDTTRRGFSTKREAQLALNQLLVDFENGQVEKQQLTTFKEMYQIWFDVYKTTVKEATWITTKQRIEKYVLPIFGDMLLERIDVKTAQKTVNEWSKQFAMYSKLLTYVRMICDHAVSLEIIASNPFRKISKPTAIAVSKKKEFKFYTKDQLITFLNFLDERVNSISPKSEVQYYYAEFDRAIFRLLAFSGARIGEVLALNWKDIDLKGNSVNIDKTLSKTADGFRVSTTKTANSDRKISLDDKTIAVLKRWHLKQKELLLKNGIKNKELVFTDITGKMIYRTDIYQRSKRIADKCGLHNIGNHGFRHTHASLLFEAEANFKDVQTRLGHSSIDITMDIYTHVTETTEKKTADKFANYVGF
ncbi:site-specific integrase [Enterococcus innesii]|uniref:site-specific integrase n=1 Tax=Enterococcus innesii TaxID=2839759 RepID=UPI002DB7B190|nr:site-specific integrase [Enterococcus innesii]MEB5950651.1 site-specific integrase [Enterococcus innesii]